MPDVAPTCPVCRGPTRLHEEVRVRHRHAARLHLCPSCGFITLHHPHWLAEAYAQPVHPSDTGHVARNLRLSRQTATLINGFLDPSGPFLDFGGGSGLFVRLMRDLGFDFRWQDAHASNLFAKGFEWSPTTDVRLATAFEVFEHIGEPHSVLGALAPRADAILFSTEIRPDPAPAADAWWYYGLSHGQHVSFYTVQSLELLGRAHGYHLLTDHQRLHLYHKHPLPASTIPRIKSRWFQRLQYWLHGRPPLTQADHEAALRADNLVS